jgi:hypothetical protein
MVTAKDIDYLLRGLFGDDWHDYRHERARVQTGSALAMFCVLQKPRHLRLGLELSSKVSSPHIPRVCIATLYRQNSTNATSFQGLQRAPARVFQLIVRVREA